MATMRTNGKPYWELDECGCCGAAIGHCSDWPWHLNDDDCRAIRTPAGFDDGSTCDTCRATAGR